jgi:hypothetical protein
MHQCAHAAACFTGSSGARATVRQGCIASSASMLCRWQCAQAAECLGIRLFVQQCRHGSAVCPCSAVRCVGSSAVRMQQWCFIKYVQQCSQATAVCTCSSVVRRQQWCFIEFVQQCSHATAVCTCSSVVRRQQSSWASECVFSSAAMQQPSAPAVWCAGSCMVVRKLQQHRLPSRLGSSSSSSGAWLARLGIDQASEGAHGVD